MTEPTAKITMTYRGHTLVVDKNAGAIADGLTALGGLTDGEASDVSPSPVFVSEPAFVPGNFTVSTLPPGFDISRLPAVGIIHTTQKTYDLATIMARHFYWGWAVYDSELGEGVEAMFATYREAAKHRDEHWNAEGEDHPSKCGDAADVEIFPLLVFRGRGHEGPGHRLTREEIDALGPCPHLDAIDQLGEGAWAHGIDNTMED
jgi:hypothetical protein